MLLRRTSSSDEISALIEETSFLMFFRNDISGFSIDECVEPELWFTDDVRGGYFV